MLFRIKYLSFGESAVSKTKGLRGVSVTKKASEDDAIFTSMEPCGKRSKRNGDYERTTEVADDVLFFFLTHLVCGSVLRRKA